MHIRLKTAVSAACLLLAPLAGPALADPEGIWSMSNGKVTVRVDDCGGNLCAEIVGLKEPISKIDGKPKVDRENPDPDKRKRPLIGLSILIGREPSTTLTMARPTAPRCAMKVRT
jgi:hypothetical protein